MAVDYDHLSKVSLFIIDQTSKLAKQYSQRILDNLQIDIHVDQWVLLKIIDENVPMSQKQLAIKSHRDPASITRTIDILEKKQLVRREKMISDRRQYIICMRQEGKDFIGRNMPLINEMRRQSIEGFSKKELETLHKYLHRIQNNLL